MVTRINAICDNHPGLKGQSIRVPGHGAAATGSGASPGYYNNDYYYYPGYYLFEQSH